MLKDEIKKKLLKNYQSEKNNKKMRIKFARKENLIRIKL